MKQTSIEWLIEKLDKLDNEHFINKLENKFSLRFYELTKNQIIEQAKEMHKQELIKTWDIAIFQNLIQEYPLMGNVLKKYNNFDDYYQETFKQPKQ